MLNVQLELSVSGAQRRILGKSYCLWSCQPVPATMSLACEEVTKIVTISQMLRHQPREVKELE